jgi:putative transcriptional regulator
MTQSIKHHLTTPLLMGYAAGTLPEAFSLVVATHVSLCDECRAALAAFDAVGGETMLAAAPVVMADSALAATLAKIAMGDAVTEVPHRTGPYPAPMAAYMTHPPKWRKIGGGVKQIVLHTGARATVRLLKIPAGSAVPDHGHKGTELTLVLQGAFADQTDRFGVGDLEIANEDMRHTPIAESGPDCICLAATDAPLAFHGLLPRIAGRIMGI